MATDLSHDLQDAVRSTLTQQKAGAASSLGSFAGALRKAAKETDGEGEGVGRMAQWAADGLERVSSTLRSKDLDGMVREVQSFARQQPVAFFAAAVAAGFLATRFLKAGSPQESEPPSAAGVHPSDVSSDIPF